MLLPDHPDKFDLDWLAQKLKQSAGAGALEDISFAPIGTGQVGDSYRVTLNWREEAVGVPRTIVAKCPAQDKQSRQTGVQLHNYAMEVGWYQNYGARAKIRTPHCYYVAIDEGLENFVLLMEDLAPARQGDQLGGGSIEEVGLMLTEAAHLHGFKWDNREIEKIEWLNYNTSSRDFVKQFVPQIYPEWRERYKGRIEETILEMGDDFILRLESYFTPRSAPLVIAHNDLRLDNVLLRDRAGRAVIVDWQTVSTGTPMADVGYCIGTSFASAAERATSEERLIRNYLRVLGDYNDNKYPFEQAWQDYRRAVLAGFFMGVIAAMLVERTERGDEMFAVMAERSGAAALHLDSLSLL